MTHLQTRIVLILLVTAALVACGSKKIRVEVPPQISLASMGTIGVVAFDIQSDDKLPGDITLKVIQHLQSAQPGVPILELGNQADVLREVGYSTLDTAAVKAIGQKYGVDTLLTGTLEVTKLLPDVKFGEDLTSMSASSYVPATSMPVCARPAPERLSGRTVHTANGNWPA